MMKKVTLAGIVLSALAFVALFAMPTFQDQAYAADSGAVASSLLAGTNCEKDVCVNANDCQDSADNRGCNMAGEKCSTYNCEASPQ